MKDKVYILIFFYWLVLEYILEGFFHHFSLYRFLNVIENLFFIVLIIFIVNHVNPNIIKRKLCGLLIVLIVIMLWFETIMYYQFKIHFGPSSFYVLINTNPDELIEFNNEYINIQVLVVTILFFIPLIKLNSIINSVLSFTSKYPIKHFKLVKLVSITLIVFTVFKFTSLIDHNLPYSICRSVVINYKENKSLQDFNKKLYANKGLVKNQNAEDKSTFIIVIGESTTSKHMQLYDYYRPTTPLLYKQKDSLSIYKDIISPNTSTFHSLSKALTLGNYENPQKNLAFPITKLFNMAGFKTFWISNHSPAFNPSSALTRITNEAQIKYFNSKEMLKFDEELLPKLDEALNDNSAQKVIFLHLIGAHFSYKNRYPKEFDFFKEVPKTNFRSKIAYKKTNEYDNAIRYTDYIVNEVIQKLKNENKRSFLMFFSDHGEEVFQDENFYGHLEDRPTKSTFDIPLLMWYSKDYNYPKDYVFNQNVKYMTDDLWHSIAHISGIECEFVELERSIFSSKFVNRRRLILKGKDYDTFFK